MSLFKNKVTNEKRNKAAKWLRIISGLLYLVSLFVPVFIGVPQSGFSALLFGWTVSPLAWVGNIFYLVALANGWKYSDRNVLFSLLSFISIGVAFNITFIQERATFSDSETKYIPVSPGYGFWLWVAALVLLFISVIIAKTKETKE